MSRGSGRAWLHTQRGSGLASHPHSVTNLRATRRIVGVQCREPLWTWPPALWRAPRGMHRSRLPPSMPMGCTAAVSRLGHLMSERAEAHDRFLCLSVPTTSGTGRSSRPSLATSTARWRQSPPRPPETGLSSSKRATLSAIPCAWLKTQYSFSTVPSAQGTQSGHSVPPSPRVGISSGAEFLVATCGAMVTLPAYPESPAANGIRFNLAGEVDGLF